MSGLQLLPLIFTAPWDRFASKCTRQPSCDLWDENMLLEERERARVAERGRQQQLRHPVPVQALEPPPPYRPQAAPIAGEEPNDLEWLRNPSKNFCFFHLASHPPVHNFAEGVSGGHAFTTRMMRSLVCGYCDTRANSLADLVYHLEHVRHHSVFACCGRFFSREDHFERHCSSRVKSGRHQHKVVRRAGL